MLRSYRPSPISKAGPESTPLPADLARREQLKANVPPVHLRLPPNDGRLGRYELDLDEGGDLIL